MADNSRKNKAIVTEFYNDVFIGHDLSKLDGYMRDDYIQHNQDVGQGKAGFVKFFKETFRAIPDFKYTLIKMAAEGDTVMAYSTTTGTHTGGAWLGKSPPAAGWALMSWTFSGYRTVKSPSIGMSRILSVFSGRLE